MTIASEINRLEAAKSDIKTSIEGKWVSVPVNAKIDEYSWYIDQITTGFSNLGGVKLMNVYVDSKDWAP